MQKNISITIVSLFMMLSTAHAYVSSETAEVAKTMGVNNFSEVKFDTGTSGLSEDQKKEISSTVAKAREQGDIQKVRVLAWSDKEYPARGVKYGKEDIQLADNRLQEVKNYLQTLNVSTVDTFNMAERPNKISKFLKTSDANMKGHVEAQGAAPTDQEQTGFLGLKGQGSKALIMVVQ